MILIYRLVKINALILYESHHISTGTPAMKRWPKSSTA